MSEEIARLDLLMETSWEVCNKVGGIYTVLSTKAKTLHDIYGDKLIFIGPDVWSAEAESPYFKEVKSLLKGWRAGLELPYGMSVRVGRWQVPGKPIAVLVRFDGLYAVNNELYGRLWEHYGVDSLNAYGDYPEACAFSHAVAFVARSLYEHICPGSEHAIFHANEWTTGAALLLSKLMMPKVATVFTTHATSIGRSICGNGKLLYDYMTGYNGDQMAYELNMVCKHTLEKAAAHEADCFTTVSDVTARECAQLLEREPDVVTPNGFESEFVPKRATYRRKRKDARMAMLDVAHALTGTDYDDDTFIVVTSGRCEYRNKGLDLFLDSMDRVRRLGVSHRILAFVMVPAWVGSARQDLAAALHSGQAAGVDAPWLTHSLHNYDDDAVVGRIRALGFSNSPSDNVHVIYVPCYLNGNDGIFDMSYYDLLIGMDASVFPSYYEPWGYTPLESVAFGIPTITTSLSGFGQWVMGHRTDSFAESGVEVAERTDGNYEHVTDFIAQAVRYLCSEGKLEWERISQAAMQTAACASWSKFAIYYYQAFATAMHNSDKRNKMH